MNDTAINISESLETLLEQQKSLKEGKRIVQMFPCGTKELSLPFGMKRLVNFRGVFHYNPNKISEKKILEKSNLRRENEILGLGDFNKDDVEKFREDIFVIQEKTYNGIEVKSAIVCNSTRKNVIDIFNKMLGDGNHIEETTPLNLILERINNNKKEENKFKKIVLERFYERY